MLQPFPPPNIKPFERLQVNDGLLMNAERWRRAHDYHRQRQNVHYQSLNMPGIVCELGVVLIPAPASIEAKYRDGRWLQIQPGIAIDLFGNIIVVPEPVDFRIASENLTPDPITIYLVVSYVDPEKLRRKEQPEMVRETFRIDEKASPPGDLEVELCRLLLQPGATQLETPKDVFYPGLNALDLRYRNQARSRPQHLVRVAQINDSSGESDRHFINLSYLLQAMAALYPSLQGADAPDRVTLPFQNPTDTNYDLLYLTSRQPLANESAKALEPYLKSGGILLVEAHANDTAFIESIVEIADHLSTPIQDLKRCDRNHPLRTKPFLFAALPTINQQQIHIGYGGGIILVVGELSAAWGLDEHLSTPRETIRTAQELGINILHFAWQRRQMTQLLTQSRPISTLDKQDREKASKCESIFDKLIE